MLFAKALIAFETLSVYVASNGIQYDVYENVGVILACYRIEGFNKTQLDNLKGRYPDRFKSFKEDASLIRQPKGGRILSDLADGYYVTWPVVDLVKRSFPDEELEIEITRRPGRSGVKPASNYLVAA